MEEFADKVDFRFYLQPKSMDELLFTVQHEQMHHPLYLDFDGNLSVLNKFPNDPRFQCFLLNEDNKILSMGNPATNFRVWEVYKQIIDGYAREKMPYTLVEAENSVCNIDGMKVGKTSEAVFVLKNTGKKPLVIQHVDAACGCTKPVWEKLPVPVGKSAFIKVTITPDKMEVFNKTLSVTSNNKQGNIILYIKGIVNE
jgi:hypothetical protein